MKRSARVTLFFAALFEAQAQQSVPPGSAIDIASAEVQAAVRKTASVDISDQQLRVVSINSEYNVGIGVVHRAKTNGPQAVNGVEHSQITEIYHVISGNATLGSV